MPSDLHFAMIAPAVRVYALVDAYACVLYRLRYCFRKEKMNGKESSLPVALKCAALSKGKACRSPHSRCSCLAGALTSCLIIVVVITFFANSPHSRRLISIRFIFPFFPFLPMPTLFFNPHFSLFLLLLLLLLFLMMVLAASKCAPSPEFSFSKYFT